MNKFLIQTATYPDVKLFFSQNFNSVQDIVAIADTASGTILVTNDDTILTQFKESFNVQTLNDQVFTRMFIGGQIKSMIGHTDALQALNNITL